MAEDWFDPAGFLLAEEDGALVGFHWTKLHGGDRRAGDPDHDHDHEHEHEHAHEPINKVYVVGVHPDQQKQKLERALTITNLHHLRDLKLKTMMLYVENDNKPTKTIYHNLKFTA